MKLIIIFVLLAMLGLAVENIFIINKEAQLQARLDCLERHTVYIGNGFCAHIIDSLNR